MPEIITGPPLAGVICTMLSLPVAEKVEGRLDMVLNVNP
jgi:hypothetical protein